jgi:hypothetical protein
MRLLFACAVMLICFSCASVSGVDAEQVAVGIFKLFSMDYIRQGDESIHIHFSNASDKMKVRLLGSLDPLVDADIIIVGKLHDEWKTVPQTDAQGNQYYEAGERYREFDLYHWAIRCPFLYNIGTRIAGDESRFIKVGKLTFEFIDEPGHTINLDDYMLFDEINFR